VRPQDSKVHLTIFTNEKQITKAEEFTKTEEKSNDTNNSADIVTSSPWLLEFNKKKKELAPTTLTGKNIDDEIEAKKIKQSDEEKKKRKKNLQK